MSIKIFFVILILIISSCCSFYDVLADDESSTIHFTYYGEHNPTYYPGIWNLIGVSINITEDFQLQAQTQWNLDNPGQTQLTWGDPRLGFAGLFWNSEMGFLFANLNVELPWTTNSKGLGKLASPGSWQQLLYRFPQSNWGIYLENWVRWYRFSTNPQLSLGSFRWDLEGNFNPGMTYNASEDLRVEMRLSFSYRHIQSLGFQQLRDQDLAIQPGFYWAPSPHWNVRPYASISALPSAPLPSVFIGLSTTATL